MKFALLALAVLGAAAVVFSYATILSSPTGQFSPASCRNIDLSCGPIVIEGSAKGISLLQAQDQALRACEQAKKDQAKKCEQKITTARSLCLFSGCFPKTEEPLLGGVCSVGSCKKIDRYQWECEYRDGAVYYEGFCFPREDITENDRLDV